MGSALGGATTTTLQAILVFVISLFFGFSPHQWYVLPVALLVAAFFGFAMVCFSAGLASIVNDFQGFQTVNQFLVFPLFFLSGALFPLDFAPLALKSIAAINPVAYAVDAMRTILIGQSHFGLPVDLQVIAATVILLVGFGVYTFRRLES